MHDNGKQQPPLGNSGPEEEIDVIGMPGSLRVISCELAQVPKGQIPPKQVLIFFSLGLI